MSKKTPNVKEILLLLVNAEGAAREAVGELLVSILGKHGLKINSHTRGQTCDRRANGKGNRKGVQSQISSLNDQALFVPCMAHNFNLLLCKAACLILHCQRRLGMINRSHLPVTSSVKRWASLKEMEVIFNFLDTETWAP